MSSRKRFLLAIAVMLFAAVPVTAQAPGKVTADEASVVLRRDLPPASGVKLGETQNAQAVASAETVALQPARATRAQGRTLMLVGGAALLVGAIIGGDAGTVFMVGGGVIGLYGLYSYLR